MSYNQQLAAYKVMINQLVGSKVAEDSIDPGDVASIGIQLADLLLPILNTINDFAITGGTTPPNPENGINLDLYIQGGSSLTFWRKRNSVWNAEASVDLGIQIIDGNITLQASVSGTFVTVTAGTWAINNVIYNKPTQTQFNLAAADLNFDRIDAVVADVNSAITLVTGIASANPAAPVKPANAIIVSYVYVPSSSSGDLPYIANSNVPVAPPVTGATIDDAVTSLTKTWSSEKISDTILSIKTSIIASADFSIEWPLEIAPLDTRTYAEKHGNQIGGITALYKDGPLEVLYNVGMNLIRDVDGKIITVNFTEVAPNSIITII